MSDLVRNDQILQVRSVPSRQVTFAPDGAVAVSFLLDIRPVSKRDRTPIDLRLVIDVSPSMNEVGIVGPQHMTKIEAARAALVKVVAEDLMPGDHLTVIAFNEGAEVIQPRTLLSRHNVERIVRRINRLHGYGNGTHFSVAMETALNMPIKDDLPTRVVFLTDGESTSRTAEDHAQMQGEIAQLSRSNNIPVLICGTGVTYNDTWLKNLALRYAAGTSFKHVSDVSTLEADLRGELSFMRGLAIDRLQVLAETIGEVRIDQAFHYMPELRQLEIKDQTSFADDSGALDHFRGQQYLVNLLVDQPEIGQQKLITLDFQGASVARGNLDFHQQLVLRACFTDQRTKETEPEQEIVVAQQKLVAVQMAVQHRYDDAARIFTNAGDQDSADAMRTLGEKTVLGGRRGQDAARTAGAVVSRVHTRDHTVLGNDDTDP